MLTDAVKKFLAQLNKKEPPPRLIPPARTEGYVKSFDGTRIFWELHGPELQSTQERPMVFCYGLVCSMSQWRLQLERYSKTHPCLLVDYRGHHRSEHPSDPRLMNLSAVARDVAAAIKAQNFSKPAHIWGHSMGVNVALELALSERSLCQSLVLCCGTVVNPFQNMFKTDALEKFATPLVEKYSKQPQLFGVAWDLLLMKPEIAGFIAQFAGFNPTATSRQDVDTYIRAVASIEPRTFFPLMSELSKGMTQKILPNVKCPSLIVAGSKDLITPVERQKTMAEQLPDGSYCEIPAGSHNVQLDFGEYVCLKVEEFWRSRNLW